ncbi:hypothetical protein QO004_001968 [Rhizobium mesoamericanum]|nr:hypothetical protein [Rhizobium mesoamericanum]
MSQPKEKTAMADHNKTLPTNILVSAYIAFTG